MKFLIFALLPLVILAQQNLLYTHGKREADDRVIAVYNQVKGPFEQNQTVTFEFEHPLDGKFFTAFTFTGEPIYGTRSFSGSARDSVVGRIQLSTSQGHEIWFTVYGYDYSPGPIYP